MMFGLKFVLSSNANTQQTPEKVSLLVVQTRALLVLEQPQLSASYWVLFTTKFPHCGINKVDLICNPSELKDCHKSLCGNTPLYSSFVICFGLKHLLNQGNIMQTHTAKLCVLSLSSQLHSHCDDKQLILPKSKSLTNGPVQNLNGFKSYYST